MGNSKYLHLITIHNMQCMNPSSTFKYVLISVYVIILLYMSMSQFKPKEHCHSNKLCGVAHSQ